MLVDTTTLAGKVADELRRRIIGGELPAGQPLRQEKLAAELGVSRIPLREAMQTLEAEGLIQSEPHKGSVVAQLSIDELIELFQLRERIEPWLFGLAIPRMTGRQVAEASTILERSAQTGGAAPGSWSELNWDFHAALSQPAERPQTLAIMRRLHQGANRYVNLHLRIVSDVFEELDDHRRLVALARAGDVSGGVRAMTEHIARVADSLILIIGQQLALGQEPARAASDRTKSVRPD